MPRAEAAEVHYHYDDHDSDYVNEVPPVQNTWYEVFHAYDVRLIICRIQQTNDEAAAKDVEVRWTIDGNVYLTAFSLPSATGENIYRRHTPSTGGTDGLFHTTTFVSAAFYVDKRGKDFKVEVRMTGVPGTNQVLQGWCVRETEDIT